MGTYLNPGNSGFAEIINGDYQDKTGMISLINKRIGTPNKLICISRPRRFGKSYAAKMLCAYYDHTCNSHNLFDDKEISKTECYTEHLNKYNVIYLDIAGFISEYPELKDKTIQVLSVNIQAIFCWLVLTMTKIPKCIPAK